MNGDSGIPFLEEMVSNLVAVGHHYDEDYIRFIIRAGNSDTGNFQHGSGKSIEVSRDWNECFMQLPDDYNYDARRRNEKALKKLKLIHYCRTGSKKSVIIDSLFDDMREYGVDPELLFSTFHSRRTPRKGGFYAS